LPAFCIFRQDQCRLGDTVTGGQTLQTLAQTLALMADGKHRCHGLGRGRSPSWSRSRSRGRSGRSGWSPHGPGLAPGQNLTPEEHVKAQSTSSVESFPESTECTEGSKSPLSVQETEQEAVHFQWRKGLVLNQKYEVLQLLGDGTFGRAVLARETGEDRLVAIKIVRDVKRYVDNAKVEASILKDIRAADPSESSRCAVMYESFTHEDQYFCMTFELLGMSLYDGLRRNNFRGYWMQDLQVFARQLLKGLKFLHQQQLTHTDLKPENVLLQSTAPWRPSYFPREKDWLEARLLHRTQRLSTYARPSDSQVKIIDFGNATYSADNADNADHAERHSRHSSTINTRPYRSPEVVLELGWNERSDLWSLGCLLMECYTGHVLFDARGSLEHLQLMQKIIGPLPQGMLATASGTVKESCLAQTELGHWECRRIENAWCGALESTVSRLPELVPPEHSFLVTCTGALLSLDPGKRPPALEALTQPFLLAHFDD